MTTQDNVHLFDISVFLSEVLDFINTELVDHHKLVAYIGSKLAEQMGCSLETQNHVALAGLMHDIGALSLSERLEALKFEIHDPHRHAELGSMFTDMFKPFKEISPLVRHHHAAWNFGDCPDEAPQESHIVHLADRISILIDPHKEILGQVDGIIARVRRHKGAMFAPHVVDAFEHLAARECFWFSLTRPLLNASLKQRGQMMHYVPMDIHALSDLARLFCRLIDFRSRFTATHSSGVAASAAMLAHFAGMSGAEARMMEVAGYFHDIGKLAVPLEILEKPDKLTKAEFNVIKSHAYYTHYLLDRIPILHTARDWASMHHERLNGRGYPFRHTREDIPVGARIMAVADVFVAMTEDRPFRKAMRLSEAIWNINNMVEHYSLDGDVVRVLKDHMDEINDVRDTAQREAYEDYSTFGESLRQAV